MFDKEAMLSFEKLEDFQDFYADLGVKNFWKIQTGEMNARGRLISDRSYTSKLRQLFADKKLFRRNVSVAEVVSWLDSYVIMERVIQELNTMIGKEKLEATTLLCEYRIKMSKNRRIDFMFVYKQCILIAEFRLSDKFPNMGSFWHKKETELVVYKELMSNYLHDYRVIIYAFIAMPEYNQGVPIRKNIVYNVKNINHFARYIALFLYQEEENNEDITGE